MLAVALAGAALVAAGCGEEPATGTSAETADGAATLTAAERRAFDRSVRRIQRHCRLWARLRSSGRPLTSEQAARTSEAVAALLELVRAKPRAPIGRSADVRLRAGDIAESVEGANCDPRLEQQLDEGIAAAVGSG